MGKIILEDMEFFAYHGFHKEERETGNNFSVTLTLEADLLDASASDDLDKTIDYEKVYQLVNSVMQEPARLLEHVAYEIERNLKSEFPEIIASTVKVCKHNPPIQGKCKKACVEITSTLS